MHVLFITPGFARSEADSITIPPLRALAVKLMAKGVRVSVIALDFPETEGNYQIEGVDVFSCGGNNRGWPGKLFTLMKAYSLCRKIVKKDRVSIIHSFWWQDTSLLGNLLAQWYKVPHLTTFMGQDVLPQNRYSSFLSVKGKMLVALSSFHADRLQETFGRSADNIIPWGIEPTDFANNGRLVKDIDVLGAGWLNPVKNFDEFVDVIAVVREKHPDIRCVICGGGEQREWLQRKVTSLELNGNITFTGLVPRNELLKFMLRSKILLHTSGFESFGYVFAEALTAGARIVSYKTGIADSSNALTGTSVPELAEHICKILEGKERPILAKVYTMDETAGAYISLYDAMKDRGGLESPVTPPNLSERAATS